MSIQNRLMVALPNMVSAREYLSVIAPSIRFEYSFDIAHGDYGQDENPDSPDGSIAMVDSRARIIMRIFNSGKVEILPL